MKKMFLLLIILFFTCAMGFAQEIAAPVQVTTTQETTAPATSPKPRIDIGAGYWWTSASLDSYVLANEDLYFYGVLLEGKGDRLSHLKNDLDAGLFIVNLDAYLFWRIYADAFIGFGDFEGEHEDYDWLWPRVWPEVWSLSKSDADGDVTTWNINGYLRIIEEKEDKGFLDVSLGYFYYQDDIEHLRNSTQLIEDWENVSIPIPGHDSQDKYTFDGLRFGARGKIRLHDRIAIKASGGICPWADAENDAYWNLKYGGTNYYSEADATIFDVSIGLEVKITKNLFVELGYKYINLDSDIGFEDVTVGGATTRYEDSFEAEAERGGFYAMGRLKI